MKSQTKNTLETVQMLQEVLSGKRGFVSLTAEAKARNLNKERLIKIAEEMGLKTKAHGKYGFCALK